MRNKILIVNWGSDTGFFTLNEIVKLTKYDVYLATTKKIPKKVRKIFPKNNLIFTNPYDPVIMCGDVYSFCAKNKITFGAVVTFYDLCVYQMAVLSEYLGIKKGLSINAAMRTSTNKYLMRLQLEKSGIRQPKYMCFDENKINEAYIFAKNNGDCVIKPMHSGNSYGARFIEKKCSKEKFNVLVKEGFSDLSKNYSEWMGYEQSKKNIFLIEEYIGGDIYSFDGFVKEGGEVEFIGSTEFELSQLPIFAEVGHVVPIMSLTKVEKEKCKKYVVSVAKSLGLSYCGFHCELKIRGGKVYLIEISGRLPGGVVLRSHQNTSRENVYDKFLSIFFNEGDSEVEQNKEVYEMESVRSYFADERVGIIRNNNRNSGKLCVNDGMVEYRLRNNGEKIDERDNDFGVWLGEVIFKSKVKIDNIKEENQKIFNGFGVYLDSRTIVLVFLKLQYRIGLLKKYVRNIFK